MKRSTSFCSSSSSSSSSCIDECPPLIANKIIIDDEKNPTKLVQSKKPKRVRAKKAPNADNSDTCPKSRSSIYRGVTRHRWTGRFEAHLWDKAWNTIQNKRGKQIYLGAYDIEEDAARTYDLAALKYWGPSTILNFPVEAYGKDIEEMEKMTKEEYLASLRRRSSGFSRGVSKYRGVARHHHNGRWEARIGRVSENKYLYLGTYSTQEEAAVAYDMAAIQLRGPNAITNFDISNYAHKLHNIPPEAQTLKPSEVQPNQEPDPLTLTNVQADEAHDHQQDESNKLVVQSSTIPYNSYSQDMMMMMDPTEEHEHPWDLCLDIDFNTLSPMPDIPLDEASDFQGLFDGDGFDDDIGYIFDDNNDIQDVISESSGCKMEGQDLPTSHSSSSLSTIASACGDDI